MVGPEAEIAVIETQVSCPAYDLESGVEVDVNDVFPDVPG
jgi:hypothetical protein